MRESSVLPKNTTQCSWPGFKPKLLDLETSALTMKKMCIYWGLFWSLSTEWLTGGEGSQEYGLWIQQWQDSSLNAD